MKILKLKKKKLLYLFIYNLFYLLQIDALLILENLLNIYFKWL